MAVQDTYEPIKLSGDGSQDEFSFNFRIYEKSDIKVSWIDKDTEEVVAVKVLGTDYDVTINPITSAGGVVTFEPSDIPDADTWVLLESNLAYAQATGFGVDSKLSEKSIEKALDRQCRLSQQLHDESNRSVKLRASLAGEGIDLILPVPVAGKLFGWNDTADGLVEYDNPEEAILAAEAAQAAALVSQSAAAASAAAALISQNAASASAAAALVSENNAETAETNAELAETNAETAQAAAELARDQAVTAKTAAELAETNAETAETNAETAETNAEAAQVAAELARDQAVTAKNAAELAETNAETAETNAELAETNAEAAQVAAEAAQAAAEAAAASIPSLASQAEAEAGTDNVKYISSLRSRQGLVYYLANTWLALTKTFTNTRVTPRVGTTTSSATPTINTDSYDMFTITALAAAITSFTTNLSGTPTAGQKLIIRIKDNGTARAIAWGASFASRGGTLPTTTVLGKTHYIGLIWNEVASTWDCVSAIVEA